MLGEGGFLRGILYKSKQGIVYFRLYRLKNIYISISYTYVRFSYSFVLILSFFQPIPFDLTIESGSINV